MNQKPLVLIFFLLFTFCSSLFAISVVTGNGTRFSVTVPISIAYVNVMVRSAKVSEDGKNLNVEVRNVGTVKLLKVEANLSKPFQADTQSLSNLEPNATKMLSFVLPNNI